MNGMWRRCGAGMAAVVCALAVMIGSARADETAAQPTPEQIEAMKAKAQKAAGEKKKPEFPKFEEVIRGYEKIVSDANAKTTFLEVYYNREEDRVLAVIPQKLIGQNFLLASSLAGGPMLTGAQWETTVLRWERQGKKKLVLLEPDLRYDEAKGSTVEDVVHRSYTEWIRAVCNIKTEKNGSPVVDLGEVFKKDFSGMARLFGMQVNTSLSKWGEIKSFPENTELPVWLVVRERGDAMSEGKRLLVHYSLSSIPRSDYKPRRADDRVGYFLTPRKDWGKEYQAKTLFNRYINRWHLEKRRPKDKLSPPKEPIVWYIEKTVPVQFRRYVKEGILEWNKAFEKCGFVDAIEVRQQTEDNEFAHLQPEDRRYNFLRWIVSGRPFAMGPSRAHPVTGQIFDADIIFDDSMVRFYVQAYRLWVRNGGDEAHDPLLAEFYRANPAWRPVEPLAILLPETYRRLRSDDRWNRVWMQYLLERGEPFCTYHIGKLQELALAWAVYAAEGKEELPEEFLGQVIKEIVAHEVGHCLGLRHNFKASTWKTMEQVLAESKEKTGVATSASVMDYNPNIFPLPGEKHAQFVTSAIGPYDYWAIEYGYRPVEPPFKSEEEMLEAIAKRNTEEGLAYGTDEDTFFFSPDPRSNRFDFGKNPIDYSKYRMELIEKLRTDLDKWALEEGESYERLRRAFDTLLSSYANATSYVARFVGGMYVNRAHKGDPDAPLPFEVVDAKTQREALKILTESIFSEKAFEFSPELLNKLGAGRWWHWDSDAFDLIVEYPVHERIGRLQSSILFQMLNPFTLRRVHDNMLKVPGNEDAFTVPELFRELTGAIWSELDRDPREGSWDERHGYISSIRRNLQRAYVRMMIDLLLNTPEGAVPADVTACTFMTLERLSKKIEKVLKAGADRIDDYTLAHLMETKRRVDKALDAEFTITTYRNERGAGVMARPAESSLPVQTTPTGWWMP